MSKKNKRKKIKNAMEHLFPYKSSFALPDMRIWN
jgi:hypothetical protein